MKTSTQSSDGDSGRKTAEGTSNNPNTNRDQSKSVVQDAAAPLPHENDQHPESQHEDAPRHVGKQAHQDLEEGRQDTDRRGGGEYQEATQNDAHSNENSKS